MINSEAVIFIVRIVFIAIISYLLGSVNTSIIVGRLYGVDIKKEGSGNAGLTNTLRVLGKKAALVVLVGDILKGVIAILLARVLAPVLRTDTITIEETIVPIEKIYIELAMQIAGIAVVLGHIFPIFYGFKGGKGVLTSITVILMTQWQVGLACIGIFLIVVLLTRYVSLGSVLAAIACPFFMAGFSKWVESINEFNWLWFSCILAVFIIVGHRGNIVRLFNNTERKLGENKEKYEERMAKLAK